jgi:DNA-binding FadR family transcriptional regulator
MPRIGMSELVAALHRRRDGRRQAAQGLRAALDHLAAGVERHLARIAELRAAVEAQGGDLAALQHYDNAMARLRAELRSAERALAEVFSAAARGDGS